MSEETDEEIDPSWWAAPFESTPEPGGFEAPEILSSSFEAFLEGSDIGELQRRVLEALTIATSAMLVPDNWLEPYEPAMQFRGRRTAIPSDLDAEQVALLARLAPLIAQPTLQARVADVAWFYGARGNVQLLDLAVDAYQATPLESHTWFSVGRDSWRRAFELAQRRGKAGREQVERMGKALQERVLASDVEDGFMTTELSDLLRESVRIDAKMALKLAEHFVALAATAAETKPRLARHLERQASAWFRRCSGADAAHKCIERIAEAYVAEADQRLAADPSAAMVAGLFLENAIAAIRELPCKYREDNGLDRRLTELRNRLSDSREASLEAMIRIESDAVDLTEYAAAARKRVSGKQQFEALAHFSTVHPLTDAEKTYAAAKEQVAGSLAQIFGRATYSHDGRKVAATGGATDNENDVRIWSQVVRTFGIRVEMLGAGIILPAQEVLTFEHRYSLEYLTILCAESPTIPAGHVGLWAKGLWHGLNGDYASAASVLVPQLEHLVRQHLKEFGVHTQTVDDETGVESEKSLSALLGLPQATEMVGADITLELRALLTEQEGANLRNHVAHGLFNDAEAWSYSAVYAWWLCLRLVVVPLWQMREKAAESAEN